MRWLLATVALLTLASCGSDSNDPYEDRDAAKTAIVNCVKLGGDPIFTSDDDGYAYFITCKMP